MIIHSNAKKCLVAKGELTVGIIITPSPLQPDVNFHFLDSIYISLHRTPSYYFTYFVFQKAYALSQEDF